MGYNVKVKKWLWDCNDKIKCRKVFNSDAVTLNEAGPES